MYIVCKYKIAISTPRQLLFPHVGLLLDTLAAGRVVSVILESCMVGGAGNDINEQVATGALTTLTKAP